MTPLVVVDKDGTLVRDVPYNVDPARIELLPGALEGLTALEASGYAVAVASNQAGVGHGLFPETALRAVEARLRELLEDAGVPLAGFYYCPHHPMATVERYRVRCMCRKPAPGMIQQALAALGARPSDSWVIGDILDDVEAGRRASCRTVLVEGGETEWIGGPLRVPDHHASDLREAARLVLAHDRRSAVRVLS